MAEGGRRSARHSPLELNLHQWCLLQRRDSQLSGLAPAFREFVLARGIELTACRYRSNGET